MHDLNFSSNTCTIIKSCIIYNSATIMLNSFIKKRGNKELKVIEVNKP